MRVDQRNDDNRIKMPWVEERGNVGGRDFSTSYLDDLSFSRGDSATPTEKVEMKTFLPLFISVFVCF